MDEKLVGHIEAAVAYIPPLSDKGWGVGAVIAEKTHAQMCLSVLREGVVSGRAMMGVFEWDLVVVELARFYQARPADGILDAFLSVRNAMRADIRYVALLKKAKEHERMMRKIERVRKRAERDRKILNEFSRTQNPKKALEAGK